ETGFSRIELAAGPPTPPATGATLYAAFAATNSDLLGIFKSADGGATWTQATRPQVQGQANYNLALAVDPIDANVVYYGTSANNNNNGGTLWRSRNGGTTWTDLSRGNGVTGGLHADTHAITISPTNRDVLFTANDGGVWRTANATADQVGWTSLNQTLSLTQFQSIAQHPTDPNILIGGTQDNGTSRYAGDTTWVLSSGGDGGYTLIDQSNPLVMYHTFYNLNNSGGRSAEMGPQISTNGGRTWSDRGCFGCAARPGNLNPADRVGFYAPMALHAGFTAAPTGNVIYFGTHRLYRTADQGVTWTGLGPSADNFGQDLTKGSGRLSAIAAHPTLNGGVPPGEVVWAGTGDGKVQVSVNAGALAGATFLDVTKAPLPDRFVTDIALDPADQRRAYVSYSGFNTSTPASPGHVFATADQGQTWADISGNLPDVPVTSLAIDPTRAGVIYIGTDIGVFQTADGGESWVRLANNLPAVATFMVRYHAASRSLVAATHGRGVYRLTLPAPAALSTVSAASFAGATFASEAIVSAYGSGLATGTESAPGLPLPTQLAGTRVTVKDSAGVGRAAPLFFVSPGQVNYQIPPGTANGAATVTVTGGDGWVSSGVLQIETVAPGIFTANQNGQGAAAAVALRVSADGAQSFAPTARFDAQANRFLPAPVDLGAESDQVFLVLFGTGLRFRSSLPAVSATVGGVGAEAIFAGAAPGFAGLDQVNLRLPRSVAGAGDVEVGLVVDGKAANPVRVTIR
ncbi:MAG TPA: hypothetical protein VFC61_07200, partial [Blastocatellia bacterium]|nr:hypothetical protein [Blastocatellia bacterium]